VLPSSSWEGCKMRIFCCLGGFARVYLGLRRVGTMHIGTAGRGVETSQNGGKMGVILARLG